MADPRPDSPASAAAPSSSAPSRPGKRRPSSASTAKSGPPDPGASATAADDWSAELAQLNYQEARTALELALAKLQSSSLEVEEMAGLYRRAQAYAERCEAVLHQVEQDVIQWDPQTLTPPTP